MQAGVSMTQPEPKIEDDGPQGNGAYRQILADIRAGVLMPGARLRETDLAERFGISRTPVREAIRQLEADGLVAHVPRQGATIRELDYTEVMELYEMRAVLEGTAARLAARAASDMELDELTALNAEMAGTIDTTTAYELNRQFHMTLLDAAKNRYLVKSVNALQKTLLILGPTTLIEPIRATQAVQEHEVVLAALRDRDGQHAEAAMRAHIEAAHRVRLRALRGRERPLEGM
jgi:DNA-binding GntR family transcriptional regulator